MLGKKRKASCGKGRTGFPCFPGCCWCYWDRVRRRERSFSLCFSSGLLLLRAREEQKLNSSEKGGNHFFPQRLGTVYGCQLGDWERGRSGVVWILPPFINDALSVSVGPGTD